MKAFSRLHPAVPLPLRGTVAALAEPKIIDYLLGLGVDTVELMPLAAWHRRTPSAGRSGSPMPGATTPSSSWRPTRASPRAASRRSPTRSPRSTPAGINVILDAVFNHTGESDEQGPTLSLRGLDNALYYRHAENDPGRFVNDTGTGNTLAVDRAAGRPPCPRRHAALGGATGIDGFRLDLAQPLGAEAERLLGEVPLFPAIEATPRPRRPHLHRRAVGRRAGRLPARRFPAGWLEWNDRYRDDVRRFWRGDRETIGPLATRLAGSADVFRRPAAPVDERQFRRRP